MILSLPYPTAIKIVQFRVRQVFPSSIITIFVFAKIEFRNICVIYFNNLAFTFLFYLLFSLFITQYWSMEHNFYVANAMYLHILLNKIFTRTSWCKASFRCLSLPRFALVITIHWKCFTSCQLRNGNLKIYLRSELSFLRNSREIKAKRTRLFFCGEESLLY